MKKINVNNLLVKIQLKKKLFKIIKKYIFILKTINYQNLIIRWTKTDNQLNSVDFIILISTKKCNIFVHLLDCLGNELFFYSIGSIGLNKKYNKDNEILQNYLKSILTNFNILKNKILIFHTLNMNSNLSWFVEKLTQKLIIISKKQFVNFAYNGCRKKKL